MLDLPFVWSIHVVEVALIKDKRTEESKTCRPTKNQFLYSSWDLGRQIDPALAIVAAAVGALPNKLFVMGVSIAITVACLCQDVSIVQRMTQNTWIIAFEWN
jgi:hypothetical protein